jgi:hypothetical protein
MSRSIPILSLLCMEGGFKERKKGSVRGGEGKTKRGKNFLAFKWTEREGGRTRGKEKAPVRERERGEERVRVILTTRREINMWYM